jgi:four helix bundle protein
MNKEGRKREKEETRREEDAMQKNPVDLRQRTKQFALQVICCYTALPNTNVAQVLGKQLLRAGTSVGAHYREGCRARSTTEFISKLEGGLQELEETAYWLELLIESGVPLLNDLRPLQQEVDELTAIFVTCVKKAKG